MGISLTARSDPYSKVEQYITICEYFNRNVSYAPDSIMDLQPLWFSLNPHASAFSVPSSAGLQGSFKPGLTGGGDGHHDIAACNCVGLKFICLPNVITYPDVGKKMNLPGWISETFVMRTISTIVLVGLVLGLRAWAVRRIKARENLRPMIRRQHIVRLRNITLFFIFTVVVVIWIEQLRTIAAAAVVIAAAIVIATKEFLLNIVGYFYRSTAKFFTIGDRIEIEGIRGDVIDQNLMAITLLEIGPGTKTHQYTGLTVQIPNSLFLANTVKNETNLWSDYVFHLMTIPIQADGNWKAKEKALLEAAREICSPYLGDARRAMSAQAFQHSLEEIDLIVAVYVLHHCRNALKSHAGIYRWPGQRGQRAVR